MKPVKAFQLLCLVIACLAASCSGDVSTDEREVNAADAGPSGPEPVRELDCFPTQRTFFGVWGFDDGSVWAVGENGLFAHNATGSADGWKCRDAGTEGSFAGVWGTSPNDLWLVGASCLVLHWDGSEFARANLCRDSRDYLTSVWGFATNDVWVGGSNGKLFHYDGTRWAEERSGTKAQIAAIWGANPHDIWAVGYYGAIVRYDGVVWSPVSAAIQGNLRGVWGSDRNNVFIVSELGDVCRWQGHEPLETLPRNAFPGAETTSLNAVWGASATSMWIVGKSGLAWRLRETRWVPVAVNTIYGFNRVWTTPSGAAWMVGEYGVVRYVK